MGAPLLQPSTGALVSSDGQCLNLDLGSPSLVLQHRGLFVQPFPGLQVVPLSILGVPTVLCAQLAALEPSSQSGIALSAPVVFDPQVLGTIVDVTSELQDDSFVSIPLLSVGLAYLSFGGSTFNKLFVNSNGSVTFGSGDTDWNPTASKFVSGPPRLAGLWTDLDPTAGGQVTVGMQLGVLSTCFHNVRPWSTNAPCSFTLSFDLLNGSCAIEQYAPPQSLWTPAIVGLKPSLGLSADPGSLNFGSYISASMQTGNPFDAVYQMTGYGAPAGYSRIEFPFSDGSAFTVQ
jgi:hypothetical protein